MFEGQAAFFTVAWVSGRLGDGMAADGGCSFTGLVSALVYLLRVSVR